MKTAPVIIDNEVWYPYRVADTMWHYAALYDHRVHLAPAFKYPTRELGTTFRKGWWN